MKFVKNSENFLLEKGFLSDSGKKIAFFDSGLGGLSVLFECVRSFGGDYLYFGDNARAPYGNLPESVVKKYVNEAFVYFSSEIVSGAVLACNTATAICADGLRKSFPFPIVGIEPAVFPAVRENDGTGLVLTTRATFESERFKNLLLRARDINPKAELIACPCDSLAGEIEKNLLRERDFPFENLFPKIKANFVVLGCTHYSFLRERAERFYSCKTYDGNTGVAKRVKKLFFEEKVQPLVTTFSDFEEIPKEKTFFSDSVFRLPFRIRFCGSGKFRNYAFAERYFDSI